METAANADLPILPALPSLVSQTPLEAPRPHLGHLRPAWWGPNLGDSDQLGAAAGGRVWGFLVLVVPSRTSWHLQVSTVERGGQRSGAEGAERRWGGE